MVVKKKRDSGGCERVPFDKEYWMRHSKYPSRAYTVPYYNPTKQHERKSLEWPVGTHTISRLGRGSLTEFFHVLPLLSEVSPGWIASCWRGSSKLAKRLRSKTDTQLRDIDKEELE